MISRLFFDRDDERLLEMVNDILARGKGARELRKLFDPYLHPHGIKELAAAKSLRIAAAMVELLGSLAEGAPEERLSALRTVREEVLHQSSHNMRFNVGRVLMQIMKEIIRAHGQHGRQLALAHDFRAASSGKPRLLRQQLRKYHLLEMPEAWNQLAFDHHVHDANTKGRKSPTHLIMDAWIKGIRFLGVVYYNYIEPDVAAELLEAAEIMGIEARIGVEVSACMRDKYAHIVWSPRGFLSRTDFVNFLREPEVKAFMDEGKAVAEYEKAHVLALLDSFNSCHLARLNERFGINTPALDAQAFLAFVGTGQASLVHLAEYAHSVVLQQLRARFDSTTTAAASNGTNVMDAAELHLANTFSPETLVEEYLRPEFNDAVSNVSIPCEDEQQPARLRLNVAEMLGVIERLPCRSRITLNPSNLSAADVLEVLYRGRGRITHLEIFNLKDWAQQRTQHRAVINETRLIINSGNIVRAKRLVHDLLSALGDESSPMVSSQKAELKEVLQHLPELLSWYRHERLQSRLGSDSIGRSRHSRGMGLVVIATLPAAARREIKRDATRMLPVATTAQRHKLKIVSVASNGDNNGSYLGYNPNRRRWMSTSGEQISWSVGHNSTTLAKHGNIAALGGVPEEQGNEIGVEQVKSKLPRRRLRDVNTAVLNIAKVVVGFIPAFLTFMLTKDWWLLAYFGAFIWFGITGLRNILQSVVGGGGLVRNSLLKWRDFVSWNRICDSLLFTGFSVPLLDFVVKDLLLSRGLGITTTTSAIALYSVMALANGLYLSSHNTFRGLPITAIVGNFFRSVLSIPLALTLNYLLLQILLAFEVSEVVALGALQLWAAVISKSASDLVAAVIEGTADRQFNLRHRNHDYKEKLAQLFDVYGRLEMCFPEGDVLGMLEHPKQLVKTLHDKSNEVLRLMVINALDLMYFWMYQPRAETALRRQLKAMSAEEMRVWHLSQRILARKRLLSEMLLHGLVGKRFERSLAFYLSRSDRYLGSIAKLTRRAQQRKNSIEARTSST